MRPTSFGLALLSVTGLLASNASAGSFGHSGGGGVPFFPSFHGSSHSSGFGHFGFGHPGDFGRFAFDRHRGFDRFVHFDVHRGFEHGRNGGRWGRRYFGYGLGQYYTGFYPDTTQGATYPSVTVISYSGGGYAPSAPAQENVNSGPRIIIIGTEPKGGPLPRVIYGTTGVE
jgi:hypothetical protein